MFRLAPLLLTAAAVSDETSLMQGVKPQHVSAKDEEKSKSVSSLLETAKTMLKNGATNDVVDFAVATLTQITDTVYPKITASHEADQLLVRQTHKMFPDALQELDEGIADIVRLRAAEVGHGEKHRDCRGLAADASIDKIDDTCTTEYCACERKRGCDYELWRIWKHFAFEESDLRFKSDEIRSHFCPEGANGTTWVFRDYSVAKFPRWTVQKGEVELLETAYDDKRSTCETLYTALDTKTEACDAHGTKLEKASCALANKQREVENRFAIFWTWAAETYQRVIDEVHCLEIDRWKEWRSLKTVECLLGRTKERNGRPCEESTDEYTSQVKDCEEIQTNTSISHLRIVYPELPPQPLYCTQPGPFDSISPVPSPCEIDSETGQWCTERCIPVPVPLPCAHSDCGDSGYNTEYVKAWHNAPTHVLWQPPVAEFFEPRGYTVDDHYQPVTQKQHHERCHAGQERTPENPGGTWHREGGKCVELHNTHLNDVTDGKFDKFSKDWGECTCPEVLDESTTHWDALHKMRAEGNSHCNPRPTCEPCTLAPEAPQCTVMQDGFIKDHLNDARNTNRNSDGDDATKAWVRVPSPTDVCMQATRDQIAATDEGKFDERGDGHFYPNGPPLCTSCDSSLRHSSRGEIFTDVTTLQNRMVAWASAYTSDIWLYNDIPAEMLGATAFRGPGEVPVGEVTLSTNCAVTLYIYSEDDRGSRRARDGGFLTLGWEEVDDGNFCHWDSKSNRCKASMGAWKREVPAGEDVIIPVSFTWTGGVAVRPHCLPDPVPEPPSELED